MNRRSSDGGRPTEEGIHITNGDASGGTLKQAIGLEPEQLLVFCDHLSFGPWIDFEDLEEWDRVRQEFARSLSVEECYGQPRHADEDDYDLMLDINKLEHAQNVYLWIGSGLLDQLLLVWLVRFFNCIGVDTHRLRVVQFQHVPGVEYEVKSLSGLKSETVRQYGQPRILTDSEIEHLESVWKVLSSREPDLLMDLLADTGKRPLPILNGSLRCLLAHYPDIQTGLNSLDETLLKYTRDEGPSAVRIIGSTLGETWEWLDGPSDFYMYHRLRRMGAPMLNRKLLELTGPSPAMRDTEVRITKTGLEVLKAKANAVEVNGIDEWVCGVHLCSELNRIWFRDGDALARP